MTIDKALFGRTALVTGCNRGIGRAVAEELASQGANLVAHARREDPLFLADMNELAVLHGVKVHPIFFDIADTESMKAEVKKILEGGVQVDVLVNNAGVAHGGLFQMTPISKVREVFDVNFFAQLEMMQLLIRHMIRNQSGSIINVSSIAGIDLHAGNIAYGVSKTALIAALIHKPKLLLLDEPFVGLDPKASYVLKETFKQMTQSGMSIFFSSHVLEVVEKLTNKIAIIKQGKIIHNGLTKDVLANQNLETLFLELS